MAMYKAVTPFPRRRSAKGLNDLRRRGGEDAGIPLPPLYYRKSDESQECFVENEGSWKRDHSNTLKTPEKKNSRSPFSSSNHSDTDKNKKKAFAPIDRPPLSKTSETPPASPLVGKQLLYSAFSPVPSLAPTDETTQGTLTPSASSIGYMTATPTSHRHHTLSPQSVVFSPGSAFQPVTPARKSPSKYRRPSPVPYSPASSIGSVSAADDAARRQRAKTELCMHWANGRECPFKTQCTFAHGEHELKVNKLMELQAANLIEDAETYRTKPCLTWVSTGTCPFGKRCASIHDPRAAGGQHALESWLPHTESQGNSMNTDINVDGLHQKRLGVTMYDNPFGHHFNLEMDNFADLYKIISNTNHGSATTKRHRNRISDMHKLAIALEMRGSNNWMYKYRPQHVIYNELCMVLQQRAFRMEKSGKVFPIPTHHFNQRDSNHVMVREIAFGPDSDTTIRGVALWFNIPEREVAECTPQQSKRYRWKRAPKPGDDDSFERRISPFDSRECFYMIRPMDRDAFELATKILSHRLATVRAERQSSLSVRFASLTKLKKQKESLEEAFCNHRRYWIKWAWPIDTGRQDTDHDTPVPPVDNKYKPLLDEDALNRAILSESDGEVGEPIMGSATGPVWESFVSLDFEEPEKSDLRSFRRRLEIFKLLSNGTMIASNRCLPHICGRCSKKRPHRKGKVDVLTHQSEKCWKDLLLESCGSIQELNEWEQVYQHFQNARSRKVLTILQQAKPSPR